MSLYSGNKGEIMESDFSQRSLINPTRENVTAGVIGALLGSMVGVITVVILSQLGYIASLSGVVMGVCILGGYEKLGKKLSKKGVIVSIIVAIIMVYVAARIHFIISYMDILSGFFEAYQMTALIIKKYNEIASEFYTTLSMLYFFTFIGFVPILINKAKEMRNREQFARSNQQKEQGESNLFNSNYQYGQNQLVELPYIFYYLNPDISKNVLNLRLFMIIPVSCFFLSLLATFFMPIHNDYVGGYLLVIFGIMIFVLTIIMIKIKPYHSYAPIYVNDNGAIWEIKWKFIYQEIGLKLNFFGTNLPTTLMSQKRKEVEQNISIKIQKLNMGISTYETGVYKLKNPQVIEKTHKATKITYYVGSKQCQKKIVNGYDNLFGQSVVSTDIISMGGKIGLTLLIGMMMFTILFYFGVIAFASFDGMMKSMDYNKASFDNGIQEVDNVFQMDNVYFKLDSELVDIGNGYYQDTKRGLTYLVEVGVANSEQEASILLKTIVEDSTSFNSIEIIDYLYGENNLFGIVGSNGANYKYNIASIQYYNGTVENIAMVLSENNQLICISVLYDEKTVETDTVFTQMNMLIKSIFIEEVNQQVDDEFLDELELYKEYLGDDKYLDYFNTDIEYTYLGLAFYKAPEDMLGEEYFMEAFLPIDGEIEYVDDGYGVKSNAHGIETYYTMKENEENALELVEEVYQEMLTTHEVEEGVIGTIYEEDYDFAYKVVPYYEEVTGEHRITILIAQWYDGKYYYYSEITYLMEEYDDIQPWLLEELRDVFSVPHKNS